MNNIKIKLYTKIPHTYAHLRYLYLNRTCKKKKFRKTFIIKIYKLKGGQIYEWDIKRLVHHRLCATIYFFSCLLVS